MPVLNHVGFANHNNEEDGVEMVDIGPAKEVIYKYTGYAVLLGVIIIAGKIFFKRLEKWLRKRKR
jgi:hypothetical protein